MFANYTILVKFLSSYRVGSGEMVSREDRQTHEPAMLAAERTFAPLTPLRVDAVLGIFAPPQNAARCLSDSK